MEVAKTDFSSPRVPETCTGDRRVWRDHESKALPVVAGLALRGLDVHPGALLLGRDTDHGRLRDPPPDQR